MKRSTLLATALLSTAVLLFCQARSQFYVKSITAYNFGAISRTIKTEDTINFMAGSMEGYTYDAIKRTLGKGVAIGSSLGYSFSENFALEVDLSYLTAGATEIKFSYLTRESYQPATSKFGVSSSMFSVGAGIVLRSGGKHLDPYLKFGMSIASATVDVVDESESPEKAIMKRSQYSGGMTMGFLMAPGVEYTTRKGTTFFGELNYTGISYCPARREYTEYRENGSDRVRELSERVIVYTRSEPESYAERKKCRFQ